MNGYKDTTVARGLCIIKTGERFKQKVILKIVSYKDRGFSMTQMAIKSLRACLSMGCPKVQVLFIAQMVKYHRSHYGRLNDFK